MKKLQKKQAGLRRRHTRVRGKISGTAARPLKATEKSGATVDGAAALGLIIGKKAQENGVTEVVFDRGGNLYHGRIKAVADGAREAGLKF